MTKKLEQTNKKFYALGVFIVKQRWILLGLIIALNIFAVIGLKKVRMTSSYDDWFPPNDPMTIAQDRFEDVFGNNEYIALSIEADDVFTYDILSIIREVGEELQEKVPYADTLTSITELEYMQGTNDGMKIINPVPGTIPNDQASLDQIRKMILSKESFNNRLVSSDSKQTWLLLRMKPFPENWKEYTNISPQSQAGTAALDILKQKKYQKISIRPTGTITVSSEKQIFFGREMGRAVLFALITAIVLLILLLRSVRGVLVPLFATVSGIMVVFGVTGWLNIKIDNSMVILPIYLGLALSVGYSVHLYNFFIRHFKQNGNRKEAVYHSVSHAGWPLLFTALTTIGSVLSFAVIPLVPLKWVGYTCASVVITVYIYVMILMPVLMSFGKNRHIEKTYKKTVISFSERLFAAIGKFVLSKSKILLFAFSVVTVILFTGALNIKVDSDTIKGIGLKVPYIKRLAEIGESKLGSLYSYEVMIDFGTPDSIKDPQTLKKFEKLIAEIGTFNLTKKVDGNPKIGSVLDILKDLNQTVHENKKSFYVIPDNIELISQLLFLYEMSGGTKAKDWIDDDYSILRIMVEQPGFSALEMEKDMENMKRKAKELFPAAQIGFSGTSIQFAHMTSGIARGEIKSFLTALVVISILLMLVFRSVKVGLIGMIPNITPVIVIAGIMGFFGYPLDMMTMTVLPMILGIAVDDTIHFINHIKYGFEKYGNYKAAIEDSFVIVGKTLFMTTIILAATFGMYMTSTVTMFVHLGFLSICGLLSALLADYIMTPILINMTKPFGKESS